MAVRYPDEISNGRGSLVPRRTLTHLAAGTMVSRDLDAARKLYEDFLGLETVRVAEDRVLLRDRRAKHLMENDDRDFFVIDVHQVETVEKPQKMLNHWGFDVATREEVERLHAFCKAEKDNWYIKTVRPITGIHDSYGFYFIDLDGNWWEIEHRGELTNDSVFSAGDFDNRTVDESKKVNPPLDISDTKSTVLGPEAYMTHGTVDVANVVNARAFYEEVLGLRSVRRFDIAQFTSGGGDFTFVGVEVGDKHVAQQNPDNRFVLLVDDEAQLEERHAKALALKDKFGIRQVSDVSQGADGEGSFLIENADSNWFELSTRPRSAYARAFETLVPAE